MKDLYALFRQSLAGLRLMIAATIVLGLAYPVVVYGFGQVAAPWQAAGSLVTADALNTQSETARIVVQEKGADYLFTVKANQAGVQKNVHQLYNGLARAFSPGG